MDELVANLRKALRKNIEQARLDGRGDQGRGLPQAGNLPPEDRLHRASGATTAAVTIAPDDLMANVHRRCAATTSTTRTAASAPSPIATSGA